MIDDLELVHGSGNVFTDLKLPNSEISQFKSVLATKIIAVLNMQALSVRQAQEVTGFAAADFSRIRQAKLSRFTIDRLMSMLDKLDQEVKVTVDINQRKHKISSVSHMHT